MMFQTRFWKKALRSLESIPLFHPFGVVQAWVISQKYPKTYLSCFQGKIYIWFVNHWIFFKGTSVHHYCFDYCWQVLREGLHPDGRRQLRLIQIHQHLRITHHHFDTFVRRLIDLGAVGRAFWWLGKNIAHLQKNTIVSSKFKASQRYYPYYALKTRAQQPG